MKKSEMLFKIIPNKMKFLIPNHTHTYYWVLQKQGRDKSHYSALPCGSPPSRNLSEWERRVVTIGPGRGFCLAPLSTMLQWPLYLPEERQIGRVSPPNSLFLLSNFSFTLRDLPKVIVLRSFCDMMRCTFISQMVCGGEVRGKKKKNQSVFTFFCISDDRANKDPFLSSPQSGTSSTIHLHPRDRLLSLLSIIYFALNT